MKVAVVLSGSVRHHHKSVASIAMLRECGHLVDTYLHAWSDAGETVADSWSKEPAEEPTPELVAEYAPAAHRTDRWSAFKPLFAERVERWRERGIVRSFTHHGMVGMWWSLQQAYEMLGKVHRYDAVVRMRYDCAMLGGDIVGGRPGLNIPEAVDFGGICDQMGWYLWDASRVNNYGDLDAYFQTYSWIERWLESGCEFGPEVLLKKSLDSHLSHPPHRPHYKFSLHGD